MAILELIVNGTLFDQLTVNRFHYVMSGTPAAVTPSFALCHATGYLASRVTTGSFASGTLAKQHQARTSSAFSFVSAYARNLYSVTDFYESPFPVNPQGEIGGECLSPLMAFGFVSNRVRTDIRRGMKRFAGVPEASVGSGGTVTGAEYTAQAAWGDVLSDTLTYDDEGNTLTFVPAVLGLVEYTTPSGKKAYKPYATEVLQLEHVAQGVAYVPYTRVRSQNSRQYGKGS
jgi:hypothetical protein